MRFNLESYKKFYSLPEEINYKLYMQIAQKRGDLLWCYHYCLNEIARLAREVVVPEFTPKEAKYYRRHLFELIELLQERPKKEESPLYKRIKHQKRQKQKLEATH
jgi:hypothetical protein